MEILQTKSFLKFLGFFRYSFYLLYETIEAVNDNYEISEIRKKGQLFYTQWNKIYFPLNDSVLNSFREIVLDEIKQNFIVLKDVQYTEYRNYITSCLKDEGEVCTDYFNSIYHLQFSQINENNRVLPKDIKDTKDAVLFYSYYIIAFLVEFDTVCREVSKLFNSKIKVSSTSKVFFSKDENLENLNTNLGVDAYELKTPNNKLLNGTRIRIHDKREKEKEELAEREDALNNTLLYKFISFFDWVEDEKEQSEFVQRVVSELKQANILNIFRDDYLTEGKKIVVDESVKRLEKYIETVRKENVNNGELIAGFKNEPLPETIQTSNQKLKWIGTPSQFGFIIDLLIQGGYLERPKSSFTKDANFYLQHFDINTTPGTLAIEISEQTNHLSIENRKRIIIPHKDKLK
jgi:hypothetical protein